MPVKTSYTHKNYNHKKYVPLRVQLQKSKDGHLFIFITTQFLDC